ncbi:hypothetical protein F4803DRAFT_547618 [Xylaria telfairii]|nr:hypothetical protein F4803DRAFT_547618 [Xylaria telfairii]
MPDEEMEMTVDFGPTGFGEDIDIDLDFPAGEPDEDMDLGDFDSVHDIHNFNSDTRDELMAEGDDASYGMIDAVETDHNVSAVAVNDIDIELEHTVESIWQQDAPHPADFNPHAEIDYLDETTTENMDAERNDVEAGEWLPVAANSRDTNSMDHANGVSDEIFTAAQEPHEEPLLEDSAARHGESSGPININAPHTDTETTHSPVASSLEETKQPDHVDDLPEDEIAQPITQVSDQPSTVDQVEQGINQPKADNNIEHHSPDVKLQESDKLQETSHFDEITRTDPDHIDESFVSPDLEQLGPAEVAEPSNVKGDDADPSHSEEAGESADDTSEYHLGGESHSEHTHDQAGDENAPQDEPCALSRSDPQSLETSPTQESERDQDEVAAATGTDTSAIGASDRDDPVELVDHYGVYISYGETDYRLFARSEDDDPNQYFLTDKSVLDLSLAQFLTSLRDVISEEVSPLDDLVMQVDGLGIEFSESTTSDFLGKFTFGDLVVLYDKLARNEEVDSSLPIYTYLTVRPNCIRRMMALGESANAGRGLSEVALYRDSLSMDEEGANDVESPDTDFSNGDYNDGESDSIYPQEDYEEGEAVNDYGQQNSSPAAIEEHLEHILDQDRETDELGEDEDENSIGNSTNDVDELDASISKQGIYPLIVQYSFSCTRGSTCSCEDCYEAELQHLATPMRAEVRPAPGTVMPTHYSPTHMTWMTNHTITEDHATSESSVLQPQEASEDEPQPNQQTLEASESKLHAPKVTSANPSTDVPNSESTSVTATLDGEEHDEIDYNSDEDNEGRPRDVDEPNVQKQSSGTTPDLNALLDDEITWESDDEETKNETKDGLVKDTVQVSPVSLKRTRSELDALDGAGDKNDNKRRRS